MCIYINISIFIVVVEWVGRPPPQRSKTSERSQWMNRQADHCEHGGLWEQRTRTGGLGLRGSDGGGQPGPSEPPRPDCCKGFVAPSSGPLSDAPLCRSPFSLCHCCLWARPAMVRALLRRVLTSSRYPCKQFLYVWYHFRLTLCSSFVGFCSNQAFIKPNKTKAYFKRFQVKYKRRRGADFFVAFVTLTVEDPWSWIFSVCRWYRGLYRWGFSF